MVTIISRAQWGAIAPDPKKTIYSTAFSNRTGFMVHHGASYYGGTPDGAASVLRGYQRLHIANGWGDIGYNFAVDLWGNIYECRGWDKVGAHSGGYNTANIGVVLIGDGRNGDLSSAAQNAFRWLYAEGNRRKGSALAQLCHSDRNSTDCPTASIRDWVKAGGLAQAAGPVAPPPPWSDVRAVQTRLNVWLTHWGVSPLLVVDGDYGPKTKAAATLAQEKFGIGVDGIVGPETWGKISVNPVVAPPVVVPPPVVKPVWVSVTPVKMHAWDEVVVVDPFTKVEKGRVAGGTVLDIASSITVDGVTYLRTDWSTRQGNDSGIAAEFLHVGPKPAPSPEPEPEVPSSPVEPPFPEPPPLEPGAPEPPPQHADATPNWFIRFIQAIIEAFTKFISPKE
jgi:hypothetical protein